MLASISISNLAVIESLQIDFEAGLNIFTGETGAGKSVIMDALMLVLGERASAEIVRQGAPSAVVEAVFHTGEDPHIDEILAAAGLPSRSGDRLVVRREVARNGKGRASLDGHTVPLSVLKDAGVHLVDLHGQHEHQRLLDASTHLSLVDSFGDAAFVKLRSEVKADASELTSVDRQIVNLENRARDRASALELARFQLEEIEAAAVDPTTDAQAEGRFRLLSNLERVGREASDVLAGLNSDDAERPGALDTLRALTPKIEYLAETSGDPDIVAVGQSHREACYLLEEAGRTLQKFTDRLELDEDEMVRLEQRIGVLHRLTRKYGPTLDDIVANRERLSAEVDGLENLESDRGRLDERRRLLADRLARSVERLSERRRKLCKDLETRMRHQLVDLGLEHARLKLELTREEVATGGLEVDGARVHLYADGIDRAQLYISCNPGEPPRPLARIASGGELSRVMLALKSSLAVLHKVPIMVFDEIDAGLGGTTAVKVARKLREVATRCQCLCITHLPQIASAGMCHFAVAKTVTGGRTRTSVTRLTNDQRVLELQRMLGGAEKVSTQHARELLQGYAT